MTKEHVHAELLRMYASNPRIEIQIFDKITERWIDTKNPCFYPHDLLRVKPECKKWRMYLSTNRTRPLVTDDEDMEYDINFISWLGDWVEQVL